VTFDLWRLRAAHHARRRRCRRSTGRRPAFPPAPCHRTHWTTLARPNLGGHIADVTFDLWRLRAAHHARWTTLARPNLGGHIADVAP
jgi:hypothetical protein